MPERAGDVLFVERTGQAGIRRGSTRLLADVGGSDAVALDYNLSENRRLIGIIMAHNLTYTKYSDYYIIKIAIRC